MKTISTYKNTTLAILAISAVFSTPTFAESVPNIDSSSWKVNPVDYGMTAKEYIRQDSNAFMYDFYKRSGLNNFHHFRNLAKASDHWVVQPNMDTIYSIATVNTSKGFELDIPDVGDRFIAIQLITQDHMTPYYLYGGGKRHFKASDFDTKYITVGIRIGTTGTKADVKEVNKLQDQLKIIGAATDMTIKEPDLKKLATVRQELVKGYQALPNLFGAMQKKPSDVKDWEYFTYVEAGAWGLSADANAMYMNGGPKNSKANECYIATFPAVPAKEFFSITIYNAQKYLASDKDNVIGNNHDVVLNKDGTFTVAFGAEKCRSLAPNYGYTPVDGWNFLLRAYRPDVKAFTNYKMPEVKLVK